MKHAVPHFRVPFTAEVRACLTPAVSIVLWAPSPWVSSRIASTGSISVGSIAEYAPFSNAKALRSGEVSMAMTRAPISAPNCVVDKPTGPCPKTARVSSPSSPILLSAP